MKADVQSYLRINGRHTLPVDDVLIKDLRGCPIPRLATELTKALKIARTHKVGLLFDMDANDGSIKCSPMSREKDATMAEDEAIVLAAELNHIFKNNPNFYRWPVKLGRGCVAYSYRSVKGADAQFVTLILGANGEYKGSYDPVHNEIFPDVAGISPKALAKIYPQILDELNNIYKKVRENIEKMRAEESEEA